MRKLLAFALIAVMVGCQNNKKLEVEGYVPIYKTEAEIKIDPKSSAGTPVSKPGKIYYKDNYLFVGEQGKGVHVFDNTNPSSPVNLAFIELTANNDVAIKGNVMYADNYTDLLAIDISNPTNVHVLSRTTNAIPVTSIAQYPPYTGQNNERLYFECVDPSKGIVVGWEKKTLTNPKCFR